MFFPRPARRRVLTTDGADMVNRDHACFFQRGARGQGRGIALKAAQEKGLHLPLAAATRAHTTR